MTLFTCMCKHAVTHAHIDYYALLLRRVTNEMSKNIKIKQQIFIWKIVLWFLVSCFNSRQKTKNVSKCFKKYYEEI